jgi:hypothetical protein
VRRARASDEPSLSSRGLVGRSDSPHHRDVALSSSRRSIALTAVVVVLVIEATIAGYLFLHGKDASPGVGWIRVGPTEELEQAGVTLVENVPAYVVATPKGLIGLYAKSPQMGEPVTYCASSGWFEDAAHGSKFDALGDYVLGPAPQGLDRLGIQVMSDDVWIDPTDRSIGAPRGTHSVKREGSFVAQAGPFCTGGSG